MTVRKVPDADSVKPAADAAVSREPTRSTERLPRGRSAGEGDRSDDPVVINGTGIAIGISISHVQENYQNLRIDIAYIPPKSVILSTYIDL
ncbi:hypothetical protein GCM10025298_26030 [Natronobiforma cellulositropha]